MNAWASSRSVRYAARAERTTAIAWRESASGRIVDGAADWARAVASGSRFLALGPAVGRSLGTADGSLFAGLAAAPYRWARRHIGEAAPGRAVRSSFAAVPRADLSGWRWLRLPGAALAGFSLAQALASVVALGDRPELGLPVPVWILAFLIGGLVAWVGPEFTPVWRRSGLRRLGIVAGAALGNGLSAASSPGTGRREGSRTLALLTVVLSFLVGAAAGTLSVDQAAFLVALAAFPVAVAAVVYRPEILLLTLAAFPWLDWLARQALGGFGGLWDELLIVATLTVLLFSAVVSRRAELSTVPITVPLLVAFAAAMGSVAINNVPGAVAVYGLRVLFQPLLFFYLGYLLPRNVRWLRRTVVVFLGASVLLALHGLFQYATNAPMPASWVDAREAGAITTRAYSVIDNPNGLGAFLLMGALVATALALSAKRGTERALLAGVSLVLVAGIAVTFSRGAWLGLAVGLVAMAALAYRRLLAALFVGGALSPLFLPQTIWDRLAFAFSGAYISKSLVAGRLMMWKVAAIKALENPFFGVGLGTFGGTTAFLWGYTRLWVDNFYLQIAAEGGLVLLLAFLWLLLRAGKGIVAGHLAVYGDAAATGGEVDGPEFLHGFTAGVFGAFCAVAFANLTAGVWETIVVGAGFWFLSGLAASLAVRPGRETDG